MPKDDSLIGKNPPTAGHRYPLFWSASETDVLAPTTQDFPAPFDGSVEQLDVAVQKAVTTGGDVTVTINGTTVVGLTCTVADAAAKGARYTDTPTNPSSTKFFVKGDKISVVFGSAFATAGALNGCLLLASGPVKPM